MSTREGMIVVTMATAKKTAGKGVKPMPLDLATKGSNAARAERGRSLYAEEGERGRREAQRKLLFKTLKEHAWNMTATAEALGMAGSPAVIKAIKDVGLSEEYEAAKERGDISPANRRS